jgi:ATP-dependent Lon protease
MDPLVKIRQHLGLPTLQELRRDYSTKQKELVPGTANWVLEQPTFLEWKKFTKPVLSLQGSPGCGKSSLSASIINHLLEIGDKNLLIGYYFFHNNDQNKQLC